MCHRWAGGAPLLPFSSPPAPLALRLSRSPLTHRSPCGPCTCPHPAFQAPAATMGGPRFSNHERASAVMSYWWGHCDVAAALHKYKELEPASAEFHTYDQLHHMIGRWSAYFADHFTVLSAPPPGQQPHMPNAEADTCIALLLGGYNKGRGHRYFTSVRDALNRSAALRALADAYHYNHRTLLRRLKRRDPTLHRSTLRYFKKLRPATCAARVRYCEQLLRRGKDGVRRYLNRVIWVDSKLLYVTPKAHLVYASPAAVEAGHLLVADSRLPGSGRDVTKVHYYAAVNGVLGGIYFKPCSGTTRFRELQRLWGRPVYKVGALAARTPASKE